MSELQRLSLYTGNTKKQKDFKDIGLNIPLASAVVDLREVKSDSAIEVITYKVLEVPPYHIVDDTVVKIGNEIVTDIKFQLEEIKKDKKFVLATMEFIVSLAYMDEHGDIKIYQGKASGFIVPSLAKENEDVFGFDDVFVPFHGFRDDVSEMSYHDLKTKNPEKWRSINPRLQAINNLINDDYDKIVVSSEVPSWSGDYQE